MAFIAGIVLFHIVLIVLEVDTEAAGTDQEVDSWVKNTSLGLTFFYFVEVVLRIYTFREKFFNDLQGPFDLTLVVADVIFLAAQQIMGMDTDIKMLVQALRVIRIGRVLRIVRVFKAFHELHMLVHGMASAVKAILWGSIMIFIMLLIFGMFAVEFVHPLVLEMEADGEFQDCEQCPRSFSSVSRAILYFTQTVIAGDNWGKVAVPVIERWPATAVLFVVALVTIQLGLLNLILAVIVERAVQARQDDSAIFLAERAQLFKSMKSRLVSMFNRIDKDGNGFLTEQEVLEGFRTDSNFADLFRTMGISQSEMAVVFQILNVDETGLLSYEDFVEQLYRMKTEDSSTYLLFNLHSMRLNIKSELKNLTEVLDTKAEAQEAALARVSDMLSSVWEATAGQAAEPCARATPEGSSPSVGACSSDFTAF